MTGLLLCDVFLAGPISQVIDDVITFLLRGKKATVFSGDGALSILMTCFVQSNFRILKTLFNCAQKALGALLGVNSDPLLKQFYKVNALPLS